LDSRCLSLFAKQADPDQFSKQRSDEGPDKKRVLPSRCDTRVCDKLVREVGDDDSVILFDIFGIEGKQERSIHLAQANQRLPADRGFAKVGRELVEHLCGSK